MSTHQQHFEHCLHLIKSGSHEELKDYLSREECKKWIRIDGLNREGMVCPKSRVAQKTLLHQACLKKMDNCARVLLEEKATPNVKATGLPGLPDKETPLHCAVLVQHRACVKLLLDHKARQDIYAQDSLLKTPLHVACGLHDGAEIVQLLLAHSADINLKDDRGRTAQQYAKDKQCTLVLKEFEAADERRKQLASMHLSPYAPFQTEALRCISETLDSCRGLQQPVFNQLALMHKWRIIPDEEFHRSIPVLRSLGLTNAVFQLKDYESKVNMRLEPGPLHCFLKGLCMKGTWLGLEVGKPFGYIRTSSGSIFAHRLQVRDVDNLDVGQQVVFDIGHRNDKKAAQNVRPVESSTESVHGVDSDIIWVTSGSLHEDIAPVLMLCTHEEADVMLKFGAEVQKQDSAEQPFVDKHFAIPMSSSGLPPAFRLFSEKAFPKPHESEIENKILGDIKSLLDEKDIVVWKSHTAKTLITAEVVRTLRMEKDPEMCTKAFAKMYEMLCAYDLVAPLHDTKQFCSLHVCEAPGAFICATNHYIRSRFPELEWDWRACSLNPYFEGNNTDAMIDDDKFINATSANWYFGCDDTGDMRLRENIEGAIQEAKRLKGPLMLVTADGSIDCSDVPNEQEDATAQLQFCETVVAIGALVPGGCFVLKMFTLFEHSSIGIIYVLRCLFEDVAVCKPVMSTPGNSETYVVSRGFRGISQDNFEALLRNTGKKWPMDEDGEKKAIVPWSEIPAAWMDEMIKCSNFFSRLQGAVIKRNLRLFDDFTRNEGQAITQVKKIVAREWIRRFKIERIDHSRKIANSKLLLGNDNRLGAKGRERDSGTLAQRVDMKENRKRIREKDALELESDHVPRQRVGEGTPSDPIKLDKPVISDFAKKLMEKMGFKEGEGLGKMGQGIQAPVQAVQKADMRAGIAYAGADEIQKDGLVPTEMTDVIWIDHHMVKNLFDDESALDASSIREGKRLNEYLMSKFCAPALVLELLKERDNVVSCLSRFQSDDSSKHEPKRMKEVVGGVFGCYKVGNGGFAGRSALKLADVNRLSLDVFGGIKSAFGETSGGKVAFIDLYGGCGGFSDYTLWRLGDMVERGIFLKHESKPPPKLEDLKAFQVSGDCSRSPLLVVEGNGSSLKDLTRISELAKGYQVCCLFGDGVKKDWKDRLLSRSIESRCVLTFLCQCVMALETLCDGGFYVCKITDTLGRCTIGTLLLLANLFQKISCIKSELSCPAKRERFLVCVGFFGKSKAAPAAAHLREVVARMESLADNKDRDVLAFLPQKLLMEGSFTSSLIKMNDRDYRREIQYSKYLVSCVEAGCTYNADVDVHQVLSRLGLSEGQGKLGTEMFDAQ